MYNQDNGMLYIWMIVIPLEIFLKTIIDYEI